nr:WYL domain-containing protein [Psychrobacter sp. I-STPA10]
MAAKSTKNETSKDNSTATTARQWQLLSQLERGRWLGTAHLHEQLMMAGFDTSLRTVQRDLNALAERFPIEKNNANPQGWRWKDDAPIQSLPHMNLSQAVAFNMVEANLAQLLPPAILDELFPWFDLARRQLKDSKVAHTWLDRVRIEPATQPLIAPAIDIDCKDAIYEALFHQKQITAQYTRRNKDEPSDYLLNPLAIVQRGVIIYLLATRADDNDATIRTFALHRFTMVSVEDEAAILPADFELESYINSGGMGFVDPLFQDLPQHGKNTPITLVFNGQAGKSLTESRLSEDQQVYEDEDNNTLTVTATVNLTSQLVWWLRGFGQGLQQIQPEILAQAVNQN